MVQDPSLKVTDVYRLLEQEGEVKGGTCQDAPFEKCIHRTRRAASHERRPGPAVVVQTGARETLFIIMYFIHFLH